ncbi:MAG: Gfo/Idh/MocA family oxidoreductase [Planctomycetota bacterium]|nr:Gfo/Idh/MocA family oxidoreductase [Planctomycetota bacterium]MDP6955916.1 Gfo/Idh/MocA family oxidoreductase [Planctomycetota bacterium]
MARQTTGQLNVAVIGTGHLGSIHARILAEHTGAHLCALVDRDLQRAGALAEELAGADQIPRAFPDTGSLLDALGSELHGAVVAVPTEFHAEVAVPLLRAGVSVLVEKPLASCLEQADQIMAAAQASSATLTVGHVERFQPGLRRVLKQGWQPRFIECHRLAPPSFRSMDVGVVHDLMIHDLDLILSLVKSPVAELDACGGAILGEREDLASVRLIFENGARASVTASRASLQPMRRFRMFSGRGYVSLDFNRNYGISVAKGPEWDARRAELADLAPEELLARKDEFAGAVLAVEEMSLEGEQRPLQAELDAFLKVMREGGAPEVTGADGRAALELAERIVGAIREVAW